MDSERRKKEKEGQESKGNQGSSKEGLDQVATVGLLCRYRVACMISLLVLACMVHACLYLVLLLSLAWVLPSLAMVSFLLCQFLDSHGVMGFILG